MDSVLNQFLYRISESLGFTNHVRRPERSGDRTRSGGPWSCAGRSGAKTAQDPGDLGPAPTGAERRYEPGFVSSAPASKTKKEMLFASPFVLQRALEDSNPRPFGP